MAKKRKELVLLHRGSLLTYMDGKSECCLGYLFHAEGHGTFDPTHGKVDVSKEEAETHNKLLSEAEIKGLDEACQVGQGGIFYLGNKEDKRVVHTFTGDVVTDHIVLHGSSITFHRNGKTYRGRVSPRHDLFRFKRIA